VIGYLNILREADWQNPIKMSQSGTMLEDDRTSRCPGFVTWKTAVMDPEGWTCPMER
jgi:hypothetical protein